MKIVKQLSFVVLLFSLFLTACKNEKETTNLNDSKNYFPHHIGKYIVYQVDSILYDDFFNRVDSVTFQLKEEVYDTISDNLGNIGYEIYRYSRQDASQPWVFRNVWREYIIDNRAERIEGNQRLIKLAFPVLAPQRWDGNVYADYDTVFAVRNTTINVYKDWGEWAYSNIDEPATIHTFNLDSTVLVIQADLENNIERRYSVERYARNIGLVSRVQKILDTQCSQYPNGIADCINLPWEEKAQSGYILKMNMIEHN